MTLCDRANSTHAITAGAVTALSHLTPRLVLNLFIACSMPTTQINYAEDPDQSSEATAPTPT